MHREEMGKPVFSTLPEHHLLPLAGVVVAEILPGDK
jgi:hypothetical protein